AFASDDTLTDLTCSVDDLTFSCHHPHSQYVCRWSDDSDCADVYRDDATFRGYYCGATLDQILSEDDDPPPPPSCHGLAEDACRAAGCRVDACPVCSGSSFVACSEANDPVLDCASPRCECADRDQIGCEQSPDCHAVFQDDGNCGCSMSGCCAQFLRC